MGRHVRDALAVNVDLAAVAQGLQVFSTREGALAAFEDGFRVFGHGGASVPLSWLAPQ